MLIEFEWNVHLMLCYYVKMFVFPWEAIFTRKKNSNLYLLAIEFRKGEYPEDAQQLAKKWLKGNK